MWPAFIIFTAAEKIMPNKRKIISSLFWKFFERAGTQLIQFGVTIALARILVPEDFGLVALIAIFINVAAAFVLHPSSQTSMSSLHLRQSYGYLH